MPDVKQLTDLTHTQAKELGISKFDLYGSITDSNSVRVYQGEPKQIKASQRASVIVRVWNQDQQVGVATTTDLTESGLQTALQTARDASNFGIRENAPDFSPEAQAPLGDFVEEVAPQAPVGILIERLLEAEKELLSAHPAIADVPHNGLSQSDVERFYINSDGASRAQSNSYSMVYLYAKAEEPGRKPRESGAYKIGRSLESLDIAGCLQEAAEKVVSHLNYARVTSGKYPVVFSPEAFLNIVGAFANIWNAQNILDNQSLSTAESLGQAIASPLLSLCDDPRHPANLGADVFDEEGTPTRRIDIIKQGVLNSFLHSSVTAKRLGATPTGNGNIGAKVSVSPHFYHIYPSTPPSSTLSLEKAENVILIDDLHALHAGVKSLQGSFSLPFDGWLLKGGERVSVESATIAGDFRELLKTITYIDAQVKETPNGVSPHVWVESLAITGN